MRRTAAGAQLARFPALAAALGLVVGTGLATGCKLLLGDPDRIIALEIVGPLAYTVGVDDTLQLRARARAANGDTVVGVVITWDVLDTGLVGIWLERSTGLVVGRSPGSWKVQAEADSIRSDPITIKVDTLTGIAALPAPPP